MIQFITYVAKYVLFNILCSFIPHPKLRTIYLRVLGAKLGNNTRVGNVSFIQFQYALRNLQCGHDVFIGAKVLIDLSATISIGNYSLISPGCSLITHQDAGKFNSSPLSKLYPTKYLPITIKDNVWVGADTTILPGTIIDSNSVIGAKSLVTGHIPSMVMAAGISAKIKKHLQVVS